MFICEDCGAIFEAPEEIKELHPYGEGVAAEVITCCPCCNSTDFTEAKQCSRCGEYVTELEAGLCDICYSEMYS